MNIRYEIQPQPQDWILRIRNIFTGNTHLVIATPIDEAGELPIYSPISIQGTIFVTETPVDPSQEILEDVISPDLSRGAARAWKPNEPK